MWAIVMLSVSTQFVEPRANVYCKDDSDNVCWVEVDALDDSELDLVLPTRYNLTHVEMRRWLNNHADR